MKDIDEYQKWTETTAVYSKGVAFNYLRFGLVAEVGEYFDKLAKLYRGDYKADQWPEIDKGLKKELGDILWFVVRLADEHGWVMSDILSENVMKLESRKQRDILKGSGDER